MAYDTFTIAELTRRFGLTVSNVPDQFGHVPAARMPEGVPSRILRYLPLALTQRTEKGRSELLVAPLLVELTLAHPGRLSFFSGIDFTVDADAGLNGRADFILARSPQQLELTAPACILVEAKNEDIIAGVPQCLAEMVAAQRFNQAAGVTISPVYGAVTTGVQWRFLTLDGDQATVDVAEYSIQTPQRIFDILSYMALGGG